MATFKNVCPFCHRNDSPPTREHVLAQWISKEFPGDAKWIIEDIITGRTFTSKIIDLVTRKVCERCNTGWMRELENNAKPILIALMKGERLTLTQDQQFLVTRWCIKTVMTHELLGEAPYYFQTDERQAVESGLAVPLPTLCFLAHYAGPKPASSFAVHIPLTAGADTDRSTPIEGYSATFTVKQLAVQIFTLRVPLGFPFDNLNWGLPPTIAMMAVQIWPVIMPNLDWPPPYYLEGDDLDVFKDRWVTSVIVPP